jgi:glycosyltransferase involved in cell wall biosynthesis
MLTSTSRRAGPSPLSAADAESPVAFVLKGYPRLSETFIAQEIRALEQRGVRIRLFSLRHPTDDATHPIHDEIRAPVTYLPEYLHLQPLRVLAAWRRVRKALGYRQALATWLRDVRRDPTRNRLRRFGQALVLAHELPDEVRWLHAHFLHTPASVTRYAALMRGLPWSVSAHAKDIWTTPDWEKREKLTGCCWLVTCTRQGADHLAALAADPAKVSLLYHGLDTVRFPPPRRSPSRRDGSDPTDPVRLLSVGRAVEKKGYEVLLQALAMLPATMSWRMVHIGGGSRLAALKQMAKRTGLDAHIHWMGPKAQDVVLEQYRAADIFVLAARIAADGDRDGLPNVLMEAHSQGLATVSTHVGGVAELIISGETGLLVAPDDAEALAAALERVIRDKALRARLGAAAMTRVRTHFTLSAGIDRLAQRFVGGDTAHVMETHACASPSTRR